MGQTLTRTYGPFVGMMNAVKRDVIPPDRISGQSANMIPDPLSGSMYRRGGTQINNDATTLGVLESKFSSKCRQIIEFSSDSLTAITVTSPSFGYLNTNESTNEGCFGYYDAPNAPGAVANRTLGDDMTSTHYPSAGSTTFIMLPLKVRNHLPSSTWQRRDYIRCADAIQRKVLAPGARKLLGMNDEIHFPNLYGTPMRWNKQFNPTGSGSKINRIRPWGNIPPLCEMSFAFGPGGAGTSATWIKNKHFYYSVAYQFVDGSFSMPVIPRPINTNLPNGFHLVTSDATNNKDTLTVTNIPVGPDGTMARFLLRSPQVDLTVAPDPSDLRICGVIRNNTQTSFVDTNGTDGSLALIVDPQKIRFDHAWPWRARHTFHFDERAAIGYLSPNPAAILLCQFVSSAGALNLVTDNLSVGGSLLTYAIRRDKTSGIDYLITSEGGTEKTFNLATYTVLQDLLDIMNAFAGGGGTAGKWRGQLVPGTDGYTPTSKLDLTQIFVNCDTVSGSSTVNAHTAGHFSDVIVGMRVTGTGIPSGSSKTYVKTATANAITLCDINGTAVNATATSGAGGQTLYIGWYVGDDAVNAGEFRAFNAAFPGILYLSEAYISTFSSERHKRTIMFTSGEPGHARNAPNSFYDALKLTAQSSAGIFMGGAALSTDNRILGIGCFANEVYRIENPRGGNTALDADIRLRKIAGIKGCIASDSIVSGDGWVGYLSEEGYVVTDGINYTIISRDIWNAGPSGLGEWSYEIGQCRDGAAADNDKEHFHALAYQGSLYCNYRSSQSFGAQPNSQIVYDYSPGLAGSGLAEITRGPNEAYGWSARCHNDGNGVFNPGTMAVYHSSAGLNYVYADDSNVGSTGDLEIYVFNLFNYFKDSNIAYPCSMFLKTDRCDTTLKKRARAIRWIFEKGSDSGLCKVTLYREKQRSSGKVVATLPSSATTLGIPSRIRRWVPISSMSPSDLFEQRIEWNDTGNSNNLIVYQAELDYSVLRPVS